MSDLKSEIKSDSHAPKAQPRRVRRVTMPPNPPPTTASADAVLPGLSEFLQREDPAAAIGDELVERYVHAFVEWTEEGDAAKTERLSKHLVTCMEAGNVVVVRAVMQASLRVHEPATKSTAPVKPAKTVMGPPKPVSPAKLEKRGPPAPAGGGRDKKVRTEAAKAPATAEGTDGQEGQAAPADTFDCLLEASQHALP